MYFLTLSHFEVFSELYSGCNGVVNSAVIFCLKVHNTQGADQGFPLGGGANPPQGLQNLGLRSAHRWDFLDPPLFKHHICDIKVNHEIFTEVFQSSFSCEDQTTF